MVDMILTTHVVETGAWFEAQTHVTYTPATDEQTRPDGSTVKRSASYRIDPGWSFQAPWDGDVVTVP